MADDATDAANDKQLASSPRYVKNGTRQIEERLVAFSQCVTDVSGEAIAKRILKKIGDWQLSATHLRRQSHNGEGAMAGKKKGVATRISQLFPKALNTQCAAHCVNLCVVKCCSTSEIQNAMEKLIASAESSPTLQRGSLH